MPNWTKVLSEINEFQRQNNPLDAVRNKYMKILNKITKRNVIAYYSGWLSKPGNAGISDSDKNAFMTTIHQLDKTKGLDLILHTPGGNVAATESLVDYLRAMFGTNIRAIIPQLAMSAGTMIACSCKEILMGKHSSLGPIDPQFGGISAQGVIEEFERAKQEIKSDNSTIPVWQTILAKYHPTFIGDCEKAIKWSEQMVVKWLMDGMFKNQTDARKKAKRITKYLSKHEISKTHERHFSPDVLLQKGVKVILIEDSGKPFQDTVLTIHHAFMNTFASSSAIKIVENHRGVKMIFVAAK
ncbi:MAG: S49 family peptidase [Elusimicrobiota bacterium]